MAQTGMIRTAIRFACAIAFASYCYGVTAEERLITWDDDDGMIVIVGDPFINMYLHPGRGYPKYHVVAKNQKMRIFKSRTDWYKIEADDGKIGWVRRKDLATIYDEDGNRIDFSIPSWNDETRPWHFGLMAGTLEGTIAYTLYSGYRFTPNLSAELRFSQAFGDFSNVKLGSVNIMNQPFPSWRVSPFFALGTGRMRTFPSSVLVATEDREDSILTVSGGIIFYASHNLAVRMEYNKHVVLTTRENNEEVEEWKAGFSVLF